MRDMWDVFSYVRLSTYALNTPLPTCFLPHQSITIDAIQVLTGEIYDIS